MTDRRRHLPNVTLVVREGAGTFPTEGAFGLRIDGGPDTDFADRVEGAGLPRPVLEFRIIDRDGRLVAPVDLAFPSHRYGIELDSVAFHFDLASFESDRRRDMEIASAGWHVDRITWRQYVEDWDWILGTLRRRLAVAEPTQ